MDRFWAKVNKNPDGCWLWTGSKAGHMGHGQVWYHGRKEYAHRLSYLLFVGEIPQGLFVLHHCDTPNCVRPDHLFLGTAKDNSNDRDAKGRTSNGQASKTHCKHGHEFTPENTYLYKDGRGRQCRACRAMRTRRDLNVGRPQARRAALTAYYDRVLGALLRSDVLPTPVYPGLRCSLYAYPPLALRDTSEAHPKHKNEGRQTDGPRV